eukprot:3816910-Pyramimonas_sp.AAC.1
MARDVMDHARGCAIYKDSRDHGRLVSYATRVFGSSIVFCRWTCNFWFTTGLEWSTVSAVGSFTPRAGRW